MSLEKSRSSSAPKSPLSQLIPQRFEARIPSRRISFSCNLEDGIRRPKSFTGVLSEKTKPVSSRLWGFQCRGRKRRNIYPADQLLTALLQVLQSDSIVKMYAALLALLLGDKDTEPGIVLFACVLQSVPLGLIQAEADQISETATKLIGRCSGEQVYMGKYCVKVMEKVLQVQQQSVWEPIFENSVCGKLFKSLLLLTGDKRPAVQKEAASSLFTLLRKRISAFHSPISLLNTHVLAVLLHEELHRKRFESTINSLKFLAGALQVIPYESAAQTLTAIVDLATNESNPGLATQAFLSLESVFAGAKIPVESVKEKLTQIMGNSPLSCWTESLQISYIQCLTQVLRNVLDAGECYLLLSPGISSLTEYLLSNQTAVQQVVATAITTVVLTCVNREQVTAIPADLSSILEGRSLSAFPRPIQKLTSTMVYLLNEWFQEISDLVFPIEAAFLQKIESKGGVLAAKILNEMERYAPTHCTRAGFKRAIAAALNTLGPDQFFQILPMDLSLPLTSTDFMQQSRSWLLQILDDYLENGNFAYFLHILFPAYLNLDTKRPSAEQNQISFLTSRYQVLEMKIWSAFPRFCKIYSASESTQSVQAFKQMFPKLTKYLCFNEKVRSQICKGLVQIAESGVAGCCAELKNAEQKFIPLLFNNLLALGSDKEMVKSIEAYPLSAEYREKMIKCWIEKAVKSSEEPGKISILLDIITALASKLDSFSVAQVKSIKTLDDIQPRIDGVAQKKVYKLANALQNHLNLYEDLLTSSEIQTCSECARTERLRSISIYLLKSCIEKLQTDVVTFLLEVLQCVSDPSNKTKKTALDLCANLAIRFKESGNSIGSLNLVLVGLGSEIGSTKAAAIAVMGKIVSAVMLPVDGKIEERAQFANDVVQLTHTLMLTLKDPVREVVKATLGFLRVGLIVLEKETALGVAPELLPAVLDWPIFDTQDAIKAKVKLFIEKLLKKLGLEDVTRLFPEAHLKRLHYISRVIKRKNKKPTIHKSENSDEEIDEEDDLPTTQEPTETQDSHMEISASAEQHFMNPIEIPVAKKRRREREEDKYDSDVEIVDGKVRLPLFSSSLLAGLFYFLVPGVSSTSLVCASGRLYQGSLS